MLKQISVNEFNNKVNIKFNNILKGFDLYSNGILEYCNPKDSDLEKESSFKNFFKDCLKVNKNKIIVDFYLKNLTNDEVANLLSNLEECQKNILINHLNNGPFNSLYFTLDCDLLMDFITTLNCKSLLFSTVYFTELPMTIWGNYDYKFPVFFESEEIINEYLEIANRNNLTINSIVYK